MALDRTVQVELPKHGIACKKISGKAYVYYVTATYRNEKGQPTCNRSSIGRLDEETGKLIPNRNYYEISLKYTKYSCEKMNSSVEKSLAVGHISGFQIGPRF